MDQETKRLVCHNEYDYYCRIRQIYPTIVYNKLRDVCKLDESNAETIRSITLRILQLA